MPNANSCVPNGGAEPGTAMMPIARTSAGRFVSLLTRDTLALVLAGGRGSRLGALTEHRAKPAVPFGGKYRLIDFPLSNCINSGIRRVGVLTQYKAQTLITHISGAWSFLHREFSEFVEVLPAQQRNGPAWYGGTADAVFQNLDVIRAHAPQFVLVLGGDHIYKMDYGTMLGFHVEHGADVTVGCIEVPLNEAHAFGVIGTDSSGRVLSFQEKPQVPCTVPGRPDIALASMGIYVFNTDYLMRVLTQDAASGDSQHDFGHNILPGAVAAGDAVYAYPFRDPQGDQLGYWRDVGTIDSYWNANLELARVAPPLNLYDRDWPIWTYQEQAPPAKFVFDDDSRRGHALNSLIAGGCIISGAVVRRSLLFPRVYVDNGAELDECVLLHDVSVGANCRLRRAVVEAGSVIPPDLSVGFDPDLDKARFEVSDQGVVVVTPEALSALSLPVQ